MAVERKLDRAERLASLLTSRNALIRKEAAEALSSFSLTNPQMPKLIRHYLQSVLWETRTAASTALTAILKSVPENSKQIEPSRNLLESLDLRAIVRDYHPLLSCELDLMTQLADCKLHDQRKILDEQLDFQTPIGVSSATFVSEDDFKNTNEVKFEKKLVLNADTDNIMICGDELDMAVQSICKEYLEDIVNMKWEIRHGAALAINSIISFAFNRLSAELIDLLTTKLFHVLALDNFIDFSSGRSAVGPVREAVSSCLSSLIIVFNSSSQFVNLIARNISVLCNMTDAVHLSAENSMKSLLMKQLWFQRQAGLLILKYHFSGPCYFWKFDEFYGLITKCFDDTHDEICSSALSAITAVFCKGNLVREVSERLSKIEYILYHFIETACNTEKQQLLDIDTTIVDLLSLLQVWLSGNELRILPYSVSSNLSHLINPVHITRSNKIITVIATSFSRQQSVDDNGVEFEECVIKVLSSIFRLVLFVAAQGTDDLIELCINCAAIITRQFFAIGRLPNALVETIGRWCSCLLLDAKDAEIDLVKYNVSVDKSNNGVQLLCGYEILTLNDMDRINALILRKLQISRFFAPLISTIYSFPSRIGDQSFNQAIQLLILPMLKSPLIMHRLAGSIIVYSWFTFNWLTGWNHDPPFLLITHIQQMVISGPATYVDEKFFFHYLENAYKEFVQYCRKKGVEQHRILEIEEHGESIDSNASKLFDISSAIIKEEHDRIVLNSRYEGFKDALARANAIMTANITRINALLVSSLLIVYPRVVLETPTLNPFIKPLMELLKFEESSYIANYILNSMSILFRMTSERCPSPHIKMIKQIVISLTSCLNRQAGWEDSLLLSSKSIRSSSARSQNAEFVLRTLIAQSTISNFDFLLDFKNRESPMDVTMYMYAYSIYLDEIRKNRLSLPSDLDNLLVEAKKFLISNDILVRFSAILCLKEMARLDGKLRKVLELIILPLQDSLRKGELSEFARAGLIELVYFLSELNVEILGALRILAPLSLRLMADKNEEIREISANAFRNLVPLMALKLNDSKINLSSNDVADEGLCDCSIDLLLGDPSQLPSTAIEKIPGLKADVVLRHYQQEGICWMSFLEEMGLNGILADDMGLGKTLQTLCLLAVKLQNNPSTKVLIVCPPTLVNHWCYEWSVYFPTLTPLYKVDEGMKERQELIMKDGYQITVASYNTIRFYAYFQEIEWYYVILDEGHVIRNPATQLFKAITSLHCRNRLILSGTPVQNTPADLWALFQFIMPGYLGSLKQFRISFLNSINACRSANASDKEIQDGQEALERLHKAVLPFVMRRLKMDVLDDLPEKIVQDYTCSMTDIQKEYYEHIVSLCYMGKDTGYREGLTALETISELRKCIVHPALVSPKALKSDCGVLLKIVEESGKLIALRELLRECGIGCQENDEDNDELSADINMNIRNRRALIFCQRLSTVRLICEFFNSDQLGMNIKYDVLDGSVPINHRHFVAENFNRDSSIEVLVLSTIGGEGLNLVGADVVIFVEHDWNPVKDLQAMDRVHRLGQKRTVNIYRLITEASIEQKIMRYQKFKTDTANALVGADNRSLKTMATEQLVELFAVEPSKMHNSTKSISSSSSQKPSKKKNRRNAQSDMDQKFDLEELWDQSQYDCFDVINLATSSTNYPQAAPSFISSDEPLNKKPRDV